jgi:UDP-N-acetylglucosamine 4,6-dehydratase
VPVFSVTRCFRFFLEASLEEICIFLRDEKTQDNMPKKYSDLKLEFYVGGARDYRSVLHATRGVDYTFHSTTPKTVPSCEFYAMRPV